MSTEQQIYTMALAVYQVTEDQCEALFKELGIDYGRSFAGDMEAFEEMQKREWAVRDKLAYRETVKVLRQAEDELIKWGHSMLKTLPQYAEHMGEIDGLIAIALKGENHLARKKVIDLTFKLKV